MQSDILSPLAPVTSARSDTFVIRVMGENQKKDNNQNQGRAWIELTVQRTPDYIKSALDAPHHRPHEFRRQKLQWLLGFRSKFQGALARS